MTLLIAKLYYVFGIVLKFQKTFTIAFSTFDWSNISFVFQGFLSTLVQIDRNCVLYTMTCGFIGRRNSTVGWFESLEYILSRALLSLYLFGHVLGQLESFRNYKGYNALRRLVFFCFHSPFSSKCSLTFWDKFRKSYVNGTVA